MIVQCCVCKKIISEVFDDGVISHGYCMECFNLANEQLMQDLEMQTVKDLLHFKKDRFCI